MLKHFVEFWYRDFFFLRCSEEEIAERKPELVNVPKNAFAYRFYDQEQVEVDGELLKGKCKNYSGLTYLGKVYTLKEVKELFPQEIMLISNMKESGWDKVVHTRTGSWESFEEGDTVIE